MREKKGLEMNTRPVSINPNDLEDIVCDKCGSQCFQPVYLFKKLSAVLSPTGVENIIPMQLYRCADCGHVNEAFLPKDVEIKSE